MSVWCNWCGAVTNVSPTIAGQRLGCVACRRTFIVPHQYGSARLTEEEILGILGVRSSRITEDEVLTIVGRPAGRFGSRGRGPVRRAPAAPAKARPARATAQRLMADAV
jgi:hypothetical protein